MSLFRTLFHLAHSLILRAAFCSQGEHKREAVRIRERVMYETSNGGVTWAVVSNHELGLRCLDCGHWSSLGPVMRHGSNKRVKR